MPHVRERVRKGSSYGYDYLDEVLDDEELYSSYLAEKEEEQEDDDDMDNSYNL